MMFIIIQMLFRANLNLICKFSVHCFRVNSLNIFAAKWVLNTPITTNSRLDMLVQLRRLSRVVE